MFAARECLSLGCKCPTRHEDGALRPFVVEHAPQRAERNDADSPCFPMLGLNKPPARRVLKDQIDAAVGRSTAAVRDRGAASPEVFREISLELAPTEFIHRYAGIKAPTLDLSTDSPNPCRHNHGEREQPQQTSAGHREGTSQIEAGRGKEQGKEEADDGQCCGRKQTRTRGHALKCFGKFLDDWLVIATRHVREFRDACHPNYGSIGSTPGQLKHPPG